MAKKKKVAGPVAILRDGSELKIGDEITTNLSKKCEGEIFVVCEINPWPICESGFLVVVYLKSDPERKILGFKKEGVDLGPDGIDSNYFVRVEKK